MRLKVMVAGRDKTRLASLEATIARADFDVTCRHVSNGHADPLQGVTDTPDILVMQIGAGVEADLAEIAAQPTTGRPPTIVIGPAGSTACMRLAMQSGARDYLEMPVSSADLNASLDGPNLLYEGVAYVAGVRKDEVVGMINRTGDVGKAVEELLARKEQTSFFSEELSLLDVYRELTAIAATGGTRSQREKLRVVRKLFSNAGPLEGRYLSRIMLEDLRIGVGEGNVREAIARAFRVDPYQVEHAFQAINDLGQVALLAKEGEARLKEVRIELFHPVKMMLAQQGSIGSALTENGVTLA